MSGANAPEPPAWKRSASKSTSKKKDTRSAPGPGGRRGWRDQEEPKKPTNTRGVKRRIKLAVALWGLVAVIGLICFLIWLLQPLHPAALIVLGAPAEQNLALPANVAGWKGLTDVVGWIKENKSAHGNKLPRVLGDDATDLDGVEHWDDQLKIYEKQILGRKEKAVVFYFAMHGGTDSQGAYLLVDNAGRRGSAERLRMKDVIDRLGKLPAATKKLVILDATQLPSYWPAGILHNDFARELYQLDGDIAKVPNLVVLSSSDTDERSWVSEEWQESIFAHALADGLKGAADADHNYRVSALELFDYTGKEVSHWAQANREAKQTVVLLPKADGKERAKDIEVTAVVDTAKPASPDAAPGANFQAPPALSAAWDAAQKLRAEVPSPTVYAPQVWREYLATVLRYEQVLRLGDPHSRANQLLGRISQLSRELAEARELNLPSMSNALPMPAALGFTEVADETEYKDKLRSLWDAKDETERSDVWKGIGNWAQSQPGGLDRVQVKLAQLLMVQVASSPRVDRERVVAIARRLPTTNRPAELHFLAMYAHLTLNELPKLAEGEPDLPADQIKKALQIRVLAERVALSTAGPEPVGHPYSEQVYPWIKDKVEAADRERRRGEDLLFAQAAKTGSTDWWLKSNEYLDKAKTIYDDAGRDGTRIRKALQLRDQAQAELPFYSAWVARRHAGSKEEAEDIKKWVDTLEELWAGIHKVSADLDKHDTKLLAGNDVEQLRDKFDQVVKDFDQYIGGFRDEVLQDNWYRHEDALVVPFIDAVRRAQLVTESRGISDRLNKKSAENLGNLKEAQYTATDLAVREGRMALATMPKRLVDTILADARGGEAKTYDFLAGEITKPGADWWLAFSRAGEALGRCWQEIPIRCGKLVESSRGREDLGQAVTEDLLMGDVMARAADGAGASRFPPQGNEPTTELRRLRFHDLFLAQARRTYRDHWYAESLATQAYYQTVGLKYTKDAQKLATETNSSDTGSRPPSRLLKVTQAEALIKRLTPLQFSSPSKIDWTSELGITLDYDLTAQGEVLPGYPILWRVIESESPTKPLQFVNSSESDRLVAADFGGDATGDKPIKENFRLPLVNSRLAEDEKTPPPLPTRETNKLLLKGVYRGQVLTREVPVDIHRVPHNTALDYPRPPKGAITVQGDPRLLTTFSEDKGVLSIVVDHSASMLTKMNPKEPNGPDRLTEAHRALRLLLGEVKEGPVLSVWVLGINATTKDAKGDPVFGIEHVWPLPGDGVAGYKWDPKRLNELMRVIESRKPDPDAASPIANAMRLAKESDFEIARQHFKDNFENFKTLLMLTDGDDNLYGGKEVTGIGDPEKQQAARVEAIKKNIKPKFDKSDIQVSMVFFQGDSKLWPEKQAKEFDAERKRAEEQFAFIKDLQPPGTFISTDDVNTLVANLKVSRKQELKYQLEIREGQPITGSSGSLLVLPTGKTPTWSPLLRPDVYRAVVRSFVQQLQIGAGDFLQVQLTKDAGGKIACERVLLTNITQYEPKAMTEIDNWRFAIMNNALVPQVGSVEMTALLENTATRPEGGTLLLPRPAFMWLEASTPNPGSPQPLWFRWGNREWLPAPAWTIQSGRWPTNASGDSRESQTVNAWWITDRTTPPVAQSLGGRTKPINQDDPTFLNKSMQIEGEDIVIESVRVEKRNVSDSPDSHKEATCLVVRLRYANEKNKDKPVIARIASGTGMALEGAEHRLYSEAGKYTGIFWPVNEAGGADYTLQLMSLAKIKNVALHAELKNLPAPQSGNRCPIEDVPHSKAGR
jgi:hypothetical protein